MAGDVRYSGGMTEPPERTTASVFAIGERFFNVEDVVVAAYFRGELDAWWERALLLDECETQSAEMGDADEEALQAASEQFRYERDLITAEETERWMEMRGLSEEDFGDFFTRRYWVEQLGESVKPVWRDFPSAPEELRDLLRAELLMSGGFDRLAYALGCAYAAAEKCAEKAATPEAMEAARREFFARTGLNAETVPAWLAELRRDEAWMEEMLMLQVAERAQRAEVLTAEQCERMLHAMRMELTAVELETIELDSIDAANEATLCVREDGMTMEAVAAEGRYPFKREERRVEEMSPEWQQKLLCAAPGELLEPIAQGDGFVLWRLLGKIEPSLQDVRIRARVEEEILRHHFTELAASRVRWEPGFLPP